MPLPGFEAPLIKEPDVELVRGIAVDGTYIYWANNESLAEGTSSIGRSKLDGSEVIPHFIVVATKDPSDDHPVTVAVNATHVYWTTEPNGRVGRARLDGSEVEHELHKMKGESLGLALSATHVHWSWVYGFEGKNGIGRANLDGSSAEEAFLLLTEEVKRYGKLACDGTYLYFTYGNFAPNIGRCKLDGSEIITNFVPIPITGGEVALAVADGKLWWRAPSESEGYVIFTAGLDGKVPKELYATGSGEQIAVTVSQRVYVSHRGTPVGGYIARNEVSKPSATTGAIVAARGTIGAIHG
jgi:hypothetical protein